VLGLHARKGQLAQDFDADVTLLDPDLAPAMTVSQGRMVWDRNAG